MEDKDQQEPSKEVVDQSQQESTSEEKKFVPAAAYKEVSSDMHKFKARAKEAEARENELAERIKAIEEDKLKQEKRYEELYENEKTEREKERSERMQERNLYERAVKISALKDELGGKVKDDYLSFAQLDKIELKEDGTLSSESVQNVANTFRQEHPGLIAKDSSVNITGNAPANGVLTEQPEKTIGNMTVDQKVALLLEKKNNRS